MISQPHVMLGNPRTDYKQHLPAGCESQRTSTWRHKQAAAACCMHSARCCYRCTNFRQQFNNQNICAAAGAERQAPSGEPAANPKPSPAPRSLQAMRLSSGKGQ